MISQVTSPSHHMNAETKVLRHKNEALESEKSTEVITVPAVIRA